MSRCATAVLAVCSAAVALSADPPRKTTPGEIRERFYRCWLEVERVEAGATTRDPASLCGVQFAAGEYWVWGRRGELSAGGGTTYRVRIDPTAEPMRVDIVAPTREAPPGKREMVQAGIFRFEGDRLVVAVAPWQLLAPPGPGEDYTVRPKGFESTPANRVTVSTYTPTGIYGTD